MHSHGDVRARETSLLWLFVQAEQMPGVQLQACQASIERYLSRLQLDAEQTGTDASSGECWSSEADSTVIQLQKDTKRCL